MIEARERETRGAWGWARAASRGTRSPDPLYPPPLYGAPPHPLHLSILQAAVTPSLKNLLNSVIAGGVVLGAIVVAVSAVSGFDPINTRK
jgi:hypothetical protein